MTAFGITSLARTAALWCSSRTNRQRLRGARVQACVFVLASHPEPAILLVEAMHGGWSVPQEGVMLDETVDDAAWRCLDEELGVRIEQAERRRLATLKDIRFLGRLSLPLARHGERPIADDVLDGPLSHVTMKAKAYWGVVLVLRSQYDLTPVANGREVQSVEWCPTEHAAERITNSSRPEKADLILTALSNTLKVVPTVVGRHRWHAEDFIVAGRYCDSAHISDELEDLRVARRARALILIVFREDTFFRPLLRLAHEDAAVCAELQGALLAGTTAAGISAIIQRGFTTQGQHDELLALLPLTDLAVADVPCEVLMRLEQSAGRGEQDGGGLVSRPASVVILAFGGSAPKGEGRALDRLLLMVNSSAPVIAHRELEAQSELRRALAATERDWHAGSVGVSRGIGEYSADDSAAALAGDAPWQPDDYAKMLLYLALKLTRSSIGNVYVAKRDGESLKLIAEHGNESPIPELDLTATLPSVVGRVYNRGRALIINDIDEFRRMNPHIVYKSVVGHESLQPYAELAVPIEQGPFASSIPARGTRPAPRSTPIGVINVERVRPQDEAAGDFTPTDLAILQTIAFFYALRRAASLTTFSAHSLARLTQLSAYAPTGEALPDAPDADQPDVPIDLLPAKPTLAFIADRIRHLTRSTSVTVRVITADQRSLTRFIAVPASCLTHEHRTIPLRSTGSVNAWVARNGEPCYIPNMRDRPNAPFPQLQGVTHVAERPSIMSELCVPIRVHGRVVGTLNLESRHKSDYPDDVAAVVTALAEQAGLAISQARRADEWRLFKIHARQTARSHSVMQHSDDLKELVATAAEALGPAVAQKLEALADSIRALVDPETAQADDADTIGDGLVSARDIVGGVCSQGSLRGHIRLQRAPSVDAVVTEVVGHVLLMALQQLVENAAKVISADPRLAFRLSVTCAEVRRGHRSYLAVTVTNPVSQDVLAPDLRRLYRRPIRRERLHIGAYLVGSYVRSVGGEIWVRENSSQFFAATVEVPLAGDVVPRNRSEASTSGVA